MNLLNINKTYFLVYGSTHKVLIVIKIDKDEDFWKKNMENQL